VNEQVLHPGTSDERTSLCGRLRDLGIVLLHCTDEGDVRQAPPCRRDWLVDLLVRTPLMRQALRNATARWNTTAEPDLVEELPGVWLSPLPLLSRRRVTGYAVAVLVSNRFLDAEQLQAMCQSARLDFEFARRMLVKLPLIAEHDVPRLAALVRLLHADQIQLSSTVEAMESVGQQLAESYEEINLLYTIIQSMTVVEHPRRFVKIACEELLATLPYRWIGMLFADDEQRLKKLTARFVIAGVTDHPEPVIRSLAAQLLERAQPDAPMVIEPGSNPDYASFTPFGQTALAHPISADGHLLGLLLAGDKVGEDTAASSVDMKLLGATASHTAIFLENAALYDDLNAMFLGTLEAITASIDAKDRYTCGHSQRVAHLTQRLAEAVGLDEHTVSRMRIAGLVHDVGKIGVPEHVLLKPGRLTDDEFQWIRKHPEIGYRILKDIPQLHDILPGVLHHHERYDGRGYPAGIAGEEIPLIARLIALADSFDAMSSTRTYRMRMSREEVLAEVGRCAGGQFDPELVPIFVNLDFSGYDRLVNEHQANEPSVDTRHFGEDAA
jgi:HD-GYP domain-containing protein (c-di-GMP phosphodiesterase class II)